MQALARYTVELEEPPDGWAELSDATARARQAARELREQGVPVRLLRSIFVPEDDTCFLLYEGPSAEAVRTALRKAGLSASQELEAIEGE
jgi:Protein of unknown function (DUF4242)